MYHPSTSKEPFGEEVTYRIPLAESGVFLYPGGMYYVPLNEYPDFDWSGDVRVMFSFMQVGERELQSELQKVTRADVV
jgi:hypothetical protein